MDKKICRIGLNRAYGRSVIRVVSGFCTVSTDVALMILGMMPLRMFVKVERSQHLMNDD